MISIYMKYPMDKAIENSDVQGLGRGENGKKWFNGYRFYSGVMELS